MLSLCLSFIGFEILAVKRQNSFAHISSQLLYCKMFVLKYFNSSKLYKRNKAQEHTERIVEI